MEPTDPMSGLDPYLDPVLGPVIQAAAVGGAVCLILGLPMWVAWCVTMWLFMGALLGPIVVLQCMGIIPRKKRRS